MSLISLLTDRIVDEADQQLRGFLRPVADYVRRLGIGLIFLIVSAFAWIATLMMLLLSIFFSLGADHNLVAPALWTALISAGVGILFVLIGILFVRRPR